jgi:hypothetical protein
LDWQKNFNIKVEQAFFYFHAFLCGNEFLGANKEKKSQNRGKQFLTCRSYTGSGCKSSEIEETFDLMPSWQKSRSGPQSQYLDTDTTEKIKNWDQGKAHCVK